MVAYMEKHNVVCWICGSVADSAEHIIKKADLVRAFGRGTYRGPNAPVHVKNGKVTPFQGPKSKQVTYAPSICSGCNNTRTQPHDRAYDKFINWVLENEATLEQAGCLDFGDVFVNETEDNQLNLYKYLS